MKIGLGLLLSVVLSSVVAPVRAMGSGLVGVAGLTTLMLVVGPVIVDGAGNATGAGAGRGGRESGGGNGRRRTRAEADLDDAEDGGDATGGRRRQRRVSMEMPGVCRPIERRRTDLAEASAFLKHIEAFEKGSGLDRVVLRGIILSGCRWAQMAKDRLFVREMESRRDQGRQALETYIYTESRKIKALWKETYGSDDRAVDEAWEALEPSVRAKREAELKEDLAELEEKLKDAFDRMCPDVEDEPDDDDFGDGDADDDDVGGPGAGGLGGAGLGIAA